jgi:hypothetical protein
MPEGSRSAVAYRLDQFTQSLREALEPLVFGAVPFVVQRHPVRCDQDAAYIAAASAAGNLSHGLSVTSRPDPVNCRRGLLI